MFLIRSYFTYHIRRRALTAIRLYRSLLFQKWAMTFQYAQKPSPDVMVAPSSAAWPMPNQCSLLDWRLWRAEFNREVNKMQQKELSSI